MAKRTGKMALYEAIGSSRGKLIDGYKPITVKKIGKSEGEAPEPEPRRFEARVKSRSKSLSDKQLFALALVGVVVAMAILAVFVTKAVFKDDPNAPPEKANIVAESEAKAEVSKPYYEPIRRVTEKPINLESDDVRASVSVTSPENAVSSADNAIVITRYMVMRDLEPVVEHYKNNGFEIEIIKKDNNYLLVSKKRYTGGFSRAGSEAFNDLQTVKRIGSNYKAPADYEPFGSKPFQDAYGMKL